MQGLLWLGIFLLLSISQKCQGHPRFRGGKELQSLTAKGLGTGRSFTEAMNALSSVHDLCPSSLHLLACCLFSKDLLSLVL